MTDIKSAKLLLSKGDYAEASKVLDQLLRQDKENEELWYLRGVVSLKLNNYGAAHENFERANWIKKKAEHFKIMGMAHLETFELEEAIEDFQQAIAIEKGDAESAFFIAICYFLMNDGRSRDYLQRAYLLNKRRTRELLKSFYANFIKKDISISKKTKAEIEKKLEQLAI